MKTTNLLKAVGTANVSLIIVGIISYLIVATPFQCDSPVATKALFITGVLMVSTAIMVFGVINGILSFFVNFDFKSKGN